MLLGRKETCQTTTWAAVIECDDREGVALLVRASCTRVCLHSSSWLLLCDSKAITRQWGGENNLRGRMHWEKLDLHGQEEEHTKGSSWACWTTCFLTCFSRPASSKCLISSLVSLPFMERRMPMASSAKHGRKMSKTSAKRYKLEK